VTRRTAPPAAARSATAARASARSASRAAVARAAPTDRRAREIERTRQDIIEAAARVFSSSDWRDATMQGIAKEAGFTAASLYTYFKSKEEIFDALLLDLNRTLLASFDEHVPAGLTFEQRLELLLHRQLAFVTSRRDAIRIAFDRAPRRLHPDRGPAEYLRRLAAFVADAGERLRLPSADAARLLFGMLHATLLPAVLDGTTGDPAHEAARIVDVFLHGAVRAG
jgi:AcrR family transcriptional regulator